MVDGVRRRRRWLPGAVALVVIAGAVGVVSKRGGAGSREIDHGNEVLENGKVQPREKVEIKSKVLGQVSKVFVDAGDKVRNISICQRRPSLRS